jgi:hypothetical protein
VAPGFAAAWKKARAACHDDRTAQAFFLIVPDRDQGFFSVERPMIDDRPWQNAARHAREQFRRRVVCGSAGADRNARAIEFQRTGKLAGVPPGSVIRPRQ